jgi:hypothetical protein
VGNPSEPIVVYENKDAALNALVENPDYKVLNKLKALVVQRIREDKDGFATELTEGEKFIAGDDEAAAPGAKVANFKIDDEGDVVL